MSAGGAVAWPVTACTTGSDGTRALAASLARVCRPGDVVLLVGGLGAGKTTFAQGFAAGLGVVGPVTSPTFTLVRQYPCEQGGIRQLLHADVYRLESTAEVADLGLAELVEDGAVALVEWGDVAAPTLGDSALTVTLRPEAPGDATEAPGDATEAPGEGAGPGEGSGGGVGDEVRRVTVEGRGPDWAGRCEAVREALAGAAADPAHPRADPAPAVDP